MNDEAETEKIGSQPVEISIQKEFFAYYELWNSSKILYQLAQEEVAGYGYLYLSCATTTAFAYEAYLNHVGEEIFPKILWGHLERCRTLEKHELICDKLGIPFRDQLGLRPMQTVKELLELRNKIAHGRSERISVSKTMTTDSYDKELRRPVSPDWIEKNMKNDLSRELGKM